MKPRVLRAVIPLLSLTALSAFSQTPSLSINVNPNISIGIGIPALIRWSVTGGVPPYNMTLLNPTALPLGLTFNPEDSVITGTPTQLGTYPLQLTATDSQGGFAFASFTVVVAPGIAITTPEVLPPAVPGQPYSVQLSASGGATPYTWMLAGGTLPPGFRMDTRGIVGGVESGTGASYSFSAMVIDAQGSKATKTFSISVLVPTLTVYPAVNTASYRPGLAAGGYATIYGSNLAAAQATPSSSSLPDILGGVTVTLNGIRMPLLYVSPNQINFQVPFSMPLGKASLIVTSAGFSTPPAQVDVLAIAPGLFQTTGGSIIALNQDGSINGPANRARAGSVVVLYATGTGPLANAIPGSVAPSDSLIMLASPVKVTVGGRPAEVLFAGAAPGQGTGLAQINVRLPAALSSGDQPVILTVGDQQSNAPTLSVAAQ